MQPKLHLKYCSVGKFEIWGQIYRQYLHIICDSLLRFHSIELNGKKAQIEKRA